MTRRTVVGILAFLLILYTLTSLILGIFLAESTLHLQKLPLGDTSAYRNRILEHFHTEVEDITLSTPGNTLLKAWFIQPSNPNGKSVIILHGVTANRVGSAGFSEIFLNQGYAVLLPDSRDHGESGGNIATYGILERNDIALWTHYLRRRVPGCTYLLGESMGAAIALQSTAVTPQLCAVAVESPYAAFRQIGYERLAQATHTTPLLWRTLGRPVIEIAIAYTRMRYGIYLPDANPKAAVEHATTPTLLIAGTADRNIPMHHAQELEAACPTHCALWIVPGADHGGASTIAHAEFERRILDWFQNHSESRPG